VQSAGVQVHQHLGDTQSPRRRPARRRRVSNTTSSDIVNLLGGRRRPVHDTVGRNRVAAEAAVPATQGLAATV